MSISIVLAKDNDAIKRKVDELGCSWMIMFPESIRHPAVQMRAVDADIQAAIDEGWPLVIATHSEAIVNGIGDRIEARKWPHDAFTLVIADRDVTAGYTEDGALNNAWLFGFLAPVED